MKHTKVQRALSMFSAVAGLTKTQADALLAEAGLPPVNESSWDMLVNRYAPVFHAHPEHMGLCLYKPHSIADLLKLAGPIADLDIPVFVEGEDAE